MSSARIAVAALLASVPACAPPAEGPAPNTDPPFAAPTTPRIAASAEAPARVERVQVPMKTERGELLLDAAVIWPVDARTDHHRTPAPAIVFSHGSPLTAAERREMTPLTESWAIRWFVQRGYVVVAALRRGFGASQGVFSEGVDRERNDYARAGRAAARDIRAALAFAAAQPGIDPGRIVLAGHSAGGFGSALDLFVQRRRLPRTSSSASA